LQIDLGDIAIVRYAYQRVFSIRFEKDFDINRDNATTSGSALSAFRAT
jgi:hypothetical protein